MDIISEKPAFQFCPREEGGKEREKSCWHVNKRALPHKINFFLFIGGMGATLPYLTAFGIGQLNITATNLAVAFGCQQFLFVLLKPGMGLLADYLNKLKTTLIILIVVQALFSFFMFSIPKVDTRSFFQNPLSEVLSDAKNLNVCFRCNKYESLPFRSISLDLYLKDEIICELYSQQDKDLPLGEYVSVSTKSHKSSKDLLNPSKNFSQSENEEMNPELNSPTNSTLLHSANNICIQTIMPDASLIEPNNNSSPVTELCRIVLYENSIQLDLNFHNKSPVTSSCYLIDVSNDSPVFKQDDELLVTPYIFKTYQFWLFSLCLWVSCISSSCIFTMCDTACHEAIQGLGSDYGRTRCWGAVGWGLVAPLAGLLNDYTDSYLPSWSLMAVLCSLQIWNLTRMELVKPDFSLNVLDNMKVIFGSLEFVAFEIGVLLNGFFTGIIWFYLTLFLIMIGGNKFIIGLCHTIQCFAGEVPFMFFSDWLTKKLGHFNIVSLALFTHGVRFFFYSYIHNPWLILPVETLHGLTFGSFYSAMTSYAKLNAKPGMEVTTQSVLCTTYEAIGAGLGCVVFGTCFDHFGGHSAFFYAAVFSMFVTGLSILFTKILQCRKGELTLTTPERY